MMRRWNRLESDDPSNDASTSNRGGPSPIAGQNSGVACSEVVSSKSKVAFYNSDLAAGDGDLDAPFYIQRKEIEEPTTKIGDIVHFIHVLTGTVTKLGDKLEVTAPGGECFYVDPIHVVQSHQRNVVISSVAEVTAAASSHVSTYSEHHTGTSSSGTSTYYGSSVPTMNPTPSPAHFAPGEVAGAGSSTEKESSQHAEVRPATSTEGNDSWTTHANTREESTGDGGSTATPPVFAKAPSVAKLTDTVTDPNVGLNIPAGV